MPEAAPNDNVFITTCIAALDARPSPRGMQLPSMHSTGGPVRRHRGQFATLQFAMQCDHEARDERDAMDRAAQRKRSASVASTPRCSRAAGPRDAGDRAADFASAILGCPTSIQHQSARMGPAPARSAVLSTKCAL